MSNYTIPIDENECIGDSLDTINENYNSLDTAVTTLSTETAIITYLSGSNIYNVGTDIPLTTLSSTNAYFANLFVSEDLDGTNYITFTNFSTGNNPNIVNRYYTLSSFGTTTSYADIVKTRAGDFIFNNTDGNGYTVLGTNNLGRITITPSGKVGIGNYYSSAIIPNYLLTLDTDEAIKPSTNVWTIASDERLKENIELADTQRCYEIVKNLPLKRYTWKNDIYSAEQVPDRSKIGWIAQDVQTTFPKAIKEYTQTFKPTPGSDPVTIEDCLSVNADQVYAALYGAVQQLMTIVEQQSATIVDLQNQINQL